MRIIEVTITEKGILNGVCGNCHSCVLAQCLNDMGHLNVSVKETQVIIDGVRYIEADTNLKSHYLWDLVKGFDRLSKRGTKLGPEWVGTKAFMKEWIGKTIKLEERQ